MNTFDFAQPQPIVNPRVRKLQFKAFMKNIYPFILFIAILLLIAFLFHHKGAVIRTVSEVRIQTVYAKEEDKRIETLHQFFTKKDSPLASSSAYFVQEADKYGLDWTLMPAISGMESNFGKAMPKNSNNPFGLGGGHLMMFSTLYSSIEYEANLLSKQYKLAANNAIGSIYCPKYECNQNWAVIVTNFSEEILH